MKEPEDFTGYPMLERAQKIDPNQSFLHNAIEHFIQPDGMRAFLDQYEEWCEDQRKDGTGCEVARSNLGYVTGYFGEETQRRWFDAIPHLSHPVFGRMNPTTDQAFNAGVAMGEALKAGASSREALKAAASTLPAPTKPIHRDPKWK
jgi:hypothetical protein